LSSLQESPLQQWAAIMPELLLAGLAVLVLGFELVVPKTYRA